MADDNKGDMLAKLKVFPMKEMGKDVTAFMKQNPKLQKKFEKIEYSKKVNLDKRKWNPKKLEDGLGAVARYELKVLAVRAAKMIKDGEKKDPKKLESALEREFEAIKKEILDKVSLAIEEVEADKGDNKKALKDGKAAFAKLDKIKFENVFDEPIKRVIMTFRTMEKDLNGKGGDKALLKAQKGISDASDIFDKAGREAQAAIDFLLKTAESISKNKEADGELKGFGDVILKDKSTFESFLANIGKLEKSMDEAEKSVQDSKLDANGAKRMASQFASLSGLSGDAKAVIKTAKGLKPKFTAIEKKLK